MTNLIPAKLARRRGQVPHTRLPTAVMDNRIFEDQYNIPQRLHDNIARSPIMFGGLGNAHVVPPSRHGGAGWYGNEPEAKAGGGANMYAKSLFGMGQVDDDLLYLGQTEENDIDNFDWGDAGMGAGGMAALILGGLLLLKWKGRL